MIKQSKSNSKLNIDFEQPISAENVEKFGQILAIDCLKFFDSLGYRRAGHLLRALICDIHHRNDYGYSFSDGYDIAQTAICFLCEHFGERLSDRLINRYGHETTIRKECYHRLNKAFDTRQMEVLCLEALGKDEPSRELTVEVDYSYVDNIIERMHLTTVLNDTLNCYMSGMGVVAISDFLSVHLSTVCRRRKELQRRYLTLFE